MNDKLASDLGVGDCYADDRANDIMLYLASHVERGAGWAREAFDGLDARFPNLVAKVPPLKCTRDVMCDIPGHVVAKRFKNGSVRWSHIRISRPVVSSTQTEKGEHDD